MDIRKPAITRRTGSGENFFGGLARGFILRVTLAEGTTPQECYRRVAGRNSWGGISRSASKAAILAQKR